MTEFQTDVISLISSAINDGSAQLKSGIGKQMLDFAKNQQIEMILFRGISKIEGVADGAVIDLWINQTGQNIYLNGTQQYDIEQISEAFHSAQIDHMFLKGSVLKSIYSDAELRAMSDIDVLIKIDQYPQISSLMTSLGYKQVLETDHELIWKKPGHTQIELHKHLVPTYNKDFYEYYKDEWGKAYPETQYRYRMNNDDLFIYLFTHFAKHYRDAGAGIKYVIDFYVLKKTLEFDFSYIRSELCKLHLEQFFDNIMKLIQVWFENGESDFVTEFITNKLFDDGVYGNGQNHEMSKNVKLRKKTSSHFVVKNKRILSILFPSYSDMCNKYPILRRFAVLLPIFWIVRLFRSVLYKKDKVKSQIRKLNAVTEENVNLYYDELQLVGLDFNF